MDISSGRLHEALTAVLAKVRLLTSMDALMRLSTIIKKYDFSQSQTRLSSQSQNLDHKEYAWKINISSVFLGGFLGFACKFLLLCLEFPQNC